MSPKLLAVIGGFVVLAAAMVGLAQVTGGGPEEHALGAEVAVGHNDLSGGAPGVRTTLGLAVLAVRRGTQEELEANGLEVGPGSKNATPYYVDSRFENRGSNPVSRNLGVGLEDSKGNLISSTLLFDFGGEPFAPCARVTEGTLEPGESVETCTLVLVPAEVEVGRVHFLSDNGPDEEPEFVYWEAE